MRIIGLTGNIASGKSLVSNILKELGAEIIDMDNIGKEIQDSNYQHSVESLIKAFGNVIAKNGKINRKKLGEIVFGKQEMLKKLNDIMIPLMTNKLRESIKFHKNAKILIIDAALLFEAGWDRFTDEVWVVYVSRDIQMVRLKKREQIDNSEATKRIQAQMDILEKIRKADVVIDNTKDLEYLKQQVLTLWEKETSSI